jgi:SAM-dependent methyltransferase
MQTRQEREQAFHDVTFAEHTRRQAWGFYAITGASKRALRDTIVAEGPAGKRVLEFGCGLDTQAFFLGGQGATVTGIDISPVAVEEARRHAEESGLADQVTFEVMDAENLEFPDHSFDLVCGSSVLHHLDLDAAYREIARVLVPGGVGVFFEPLGVNPLINAYRRRTPQLRTVDEHPFVAADFALARERFADVRLEFFHLASLAAIPLRKQRFFPQLVSALDSFDQRLFRLVPRTRKHAWMVVLRLADPR